MQQTVDDDTAESAVTLGVAAGIGECHRDIVRMAMELYLADDQLSCDSADPESTEAQRIDSMRKMDEAAELLMAACARLRWLRELAVGVP